MSEPTTPTWERRFRAPVVSFPEWADSAPERLVFTSNESGVWQVHAMDLTTGERRQVTDHPVGVTAATITPDGEEAVWWQDETGDESGRWLAQPFEGGETRPLLAGVPIGWAGGLSIRDGVIAAVVADREGFGVYVSVGGAPAVRIHLSEASAYLGGGEGWGPVAPAGLSADGSLACVAHSEFGDDMHLALRVLDVRSGEVVADLHDPGMALVASCWDPRSERLAIAHERQGEARLALWNVRTGDVTTPDLGLPGMTEAFDWAANGTIVVSSVHQGRTRLHRLEPETGSLAPIDTEPGTIGTARVRPAGRVWYRHERGDRQPLVLDDAGEEVVGAVGERAPLGRPYESWHFTNPHGQTVHGFVVSPKEVAGQAPMVMFVHGGPTGMDMDRWQPEVQAYVDAGFVVAMVNYRGSVGYGREWRDALVGNVGGPELEDVNAGLADLVGRGIADPDRAVIAGWSWGGYVTLLELGKHPELWSCGVAGVPVGDYEAGYEDLSPQLQAYDRALLGGTPKDVPELMRDRNPINFVDRVRVPVLFVIGLNDSRCPPAQAFAYVDRLKGRGHPHEVYTFGTGHGSFDSEEEIRQVRTILDFLARNVRAT
jgi:dipeptidyl aminopeptidase/acylaminoacyl peptidase